MEYLTINMTWTKMFMAYIFESMESEKACRRIRLGSVLIILGSVIGFGLLGILKYFNVIITGVNLLIGFVSTIVFLIGMGMFFGTRKLCVFILENKVGKELIQSGRKIIKCFEDYIEVQEVEKNETWYLPLTLCNGVAEDEASIVIRGKKVKNIGNEALEENAAEQIAIWIDKAQMNAEQGKLWKDYKDTYLKQIKTFDWKNLDDMDRI